jgi:phenylpropionate dioxygenase-like ring-hydroxylating dioxygenase large terminal subunit
MLATRQPVLRRFWYPVMRTADLDGGPKPFTLLGEPIVLWRTSDGGVACVQDRCCHRSAKLSIGFLEGDDIVCAYHGWAFAADGRCVRIPQRLDPANTGRMGVPSYRAQDRYGHVWVALGEPLTDIPLIPEASEPGFRRIDQFYETWRIGALRLMENSFDNAHIAFVHKNSFGEISQPIPSKNEIEEVPYGLVVRTEIPVKNRGVQQRNLGSEGASEDTVRIMQNNWFMPFCRRLGIRYPNGLRHTIITAATPMTDEECMVVQWCYRNDTEADAKTEDIIAFDRQVTEEDRFVLETTDPDAPLDTRREFHMMTDGPGVTMRRMLARLLAEHGEMEITRDGPVPTAAAPAA